MRINEITINVVDLSSDLLPSEETEMFHNRLITIIWTERDIYFDEKSGLAAS